MLAAALPALLGALTGACQQGADAALAKRLHVLLMLLAKGHAHSVPSASGTSFAVLVALSQHLLACRSWAAPTAVTPCTMTECSMVFWPGGFSFLGL